MSAIGSSRPVSAQVVSKSASSGTLIAQAPTQQYNDNVTTWMNDLRQVAANAQRHYANGMGDRGVRVTTLGSRTSMADWIQTPVEDTPPRRGTTLFDLATRVGTVPPNQVAGLLQGRNLSLSNDKERQTRANIQAHWNGRPGTGASLETRLASAISNSSGRLTPADLMRKSLEVNNNDYFMALLTAHNLLKNMTASQRNQPGSQDRLTWNGQQMTLQQRDAQLASKLQNLRPPGDNQSSLDLWYHTFAIGLVDVAGGPVATALASSLESQQSRAAGNHDQAEDRFNQEAARAFGVNIPWVGDRLTDIFDLGGRAAEQIQRVLP